MIPSLSIIAICFNELFTLCTDVENGGLGIFIYLLENTLPFVRPEWKEICIALKEHQPIDTSQMTIRAIDHDVNSGWRRPLARMQIVIVTGQQGHNSRPAKDIISGQMLS